MAVGWSGGWTITLVLRIGLRSRAAALPKSRAHAALQPMGMVPTGTEWSQPVGSQAASLVPREDSCLEGGVLPLDVRAELVQRGEVGGGRSAGRRALTSDFLVPKLFASLPLRE